MSHKHSIGIHNTDRAARDNLEVTLDHEPDTPMHHSFRGFTPAAWRHKLVQSAQVLIVFLLVAAAGVWFFIDVEDLHSGGRSGREGMQGEERFPDGYTGVQGASITRSRALSRAESMGVHVDAHEDEKPQSISAKERWENRLDSITVQTLVRTEAKPRRDAEVVLLTPPCCRGISQDEEIVSSCNRRLMSECSALDDVTCYLAVAAQPPCNVLETFQYSYRDSYFASLRRAVPFLRELGWDSIHTFDDFGDANPCSQNETLEKMSMEAVRQAELVIAEASSITKILELNPQARIIVVDPSTSGVLPQTALYQLERESVAAIWRAQTLTEESLHNGPLLNGSAYLATIEGAPDETEFKASRHPQVSGEVTSKIVPILSHANRYRYPLDCGGQSEHIRFVGAFEQNESHWRPSRLVDRKIDIAFMPPLTPGKDLTGVSPTAQKLMTHQRNSLTRVLKDMQKAHPEFSIQVTSSNSGSYVEYLQQLQTTKILITIGGVDEWNEQDFDAIFSGCLLMKVNPASIRMYPALFTPGGENILDAQPSWAGISDTLLEALKDVEHAQRMADRTINQLLEFSDMRRYAADVEKQLLLGTQQLV